MANKKDICRLIANELNHTIHILHIFSVVSILIDELVIELKQGGEIKIPNFGTLQLKELKPKKIRSISSKEIKFVKKTKSLRFRLAKKISKYLAEKSI